MRFISKFTRIQFFVLLFQKLLKVASYKWKNGETGGLGAAKTPPGCEKRGHPRCPPEWEKQAGRALWWWEQAIAARRKRGPCLTAGRSLSPLTCAEQRLLGAFQRFESLFSDPNPIIGLHLISIQCLLSPTQVGTSPSSQTGKVKKILNIWRVVWSIILSSSLPKYTWCGARSTELPLRRPEAFSGFWSHWWVWSWAVASPPWPSDFSLVVMISKGLFRPRRGWCFQVSGLPHWPALGSDPAVQEWPLCYSLVPLCSLPQPWSGL